MLSSTVSMNSFDFWSEASYFFILEISRIIIEKSVTLLFKSRIAETVNAKSFSVPSLHMPTVSKPKTFSPSNTFLITSPGSSFSRSGTNNWTIFCPITSSADHPKSISAPWFQESILFSVSIVTIASPALSNRLLYLLSAEWRSFSSTIATRS